MQIKHLLMFALKLLGLRTLFNEEYASKLFKLECLKEFQLLIKNINCCLVNSRLIKERLNIEQFTRVTISI